MKILLPLILIGLAGCGAIQPSKVYTMKSPPDVVKENNIEREDWTKTEGGRFAHSLEYEELLAKPVPYQFTPGKEFRQESIDYFEHLCKTEGKDYIWDTAKNVDTVAQLRGFETPTSRDVFSYKRDPFALEAPLFFMENDAANYNSVKYNNKFDSQRKGSVDFMGMPYKMFYPHYEIKDNYGIWDYYSENFLQKNHTKHFRKIEKITAKYGWTWRGFSRPQDRGYAIAGGDMIILNLETGKIMAIQRSFVRAITYSDDKSLNWEGNGCFEQYKNYFLYKDANFEGKTFDEKIKLISNAQAPRRSIVGFLNKVLYPIIKID